ncbi:hypothetical protein Gogos_012635, partial [Gossypium gossypioides]|nr:hypothetical protein [Gossypium gossypioides]
MWFHSRLPSLPFISKCEAQSAYCYSGSIFVIILVPTLLFLISIFPLVIFILCQQYRAKALKHDPSPTKNGDLFSIWNFDGKIAFEDIIKATEDFDIKYCIGTGCYGSVYRA